MTAGTYAIAICGGDEERARLFEQTAALGALGTLIEDLEHHGQPGGTTPFAPDELTGDGRAVEQAAGRIYGEAWAMLFPRENGDPPDDETDALDTLEAVLLARLYARLASRPDYLQERVNYCLTVAIHGLAPSTRPQP